MNRTVVDFELFGEQTVMQLEDAPVDIPGIQVSLPCDVSALPAATAQESGRILCDRLRAHFAVSAGLDELAGHPPGTPPAPLYLHMVASTADELPWELLWDAQQGFWAMDTRWPIARIARRRRVMADRAFAPPLTIVAVLAAAGQSGVRQMEALLSATAGPDAQALGTRLHVISAEDAVADVVAGAERPDVTHETLAGTAPAVMAQLSAARPHIVHLLCHGGMTAGVRTLAMANLADYDAGESTGTIRLKVADLVAALTPCDPWLVVLSACESAGAAGGTGLAHDLAGAGVPAVIGMRRLVDLTATNRFCAALYPQVMAAARQAVDPGGPPGARILDWAPCLTAARGALGGTEPGVADAWSDPVIYVQEDPLRVFPPSATLSATEYTALKAQLDVWSEYLRTLDPGTTPAGLITEVVGRIATLTAQLEVGG